MSIKRGVIWDMDGVLVDTGEFHYQSWQRTLPKYGIHFSREMFNSTFGMTNASILAEVSGRDIKPELVSEISDLKERNFRAAIRGQVEPLPGVLQWLQALAAQGYRQAIASSAPPANIQAILGELEVEKLFDAILSGSALPGKPDPTVFEMAAKRIQVPPSQCVVVEDAVAGVEAALRAGMKCIAVTTTNPRSKLSGADIIVSRLDELAQDVFARLTAADRP
jgi:beta-phosphoglucomutase family hydrolase